MSDLWMPLRFSPCLHRRLTTVTTGGYHFSGGCVWDDIRERLMCLDCLEYVTEVEVRAAWRGENLEDISPARKENDLETQAIPNNAEVER